MTDAVVATVVGARPQVVKASAITAEMGRRSGVREVMIHTGQHYDPDLSDVFFAELDIPPPHHHLGIGGGRHGAMTGRMLERLEEVLIDLAPAAVLVYGDTNSTLSGAVAAAKLGISILHVEAGLRSFNRRMPEEINRVVADHLSRLLFCPTSTAVTNLELEGIVNGVHLVGDVMYDVSVAAAGRAASSDVLVRLGLEGTPFALATLHRAENTDTVVALTRALEFLRAEAERQPVVLPLHPRTRHAAARAGLGFDGLVTTTPLGYLDLTRLLQSAGVVYTDSGGLQKEAYFHRVPCVTLRDETEWVETVACGWNRLWTVPEYLPRCEIQEYGDGHAAVRIVDELIAFLDGGPPG